MILPQYYGNDYVMNFLNKEEKDILWECFLFDILLLRWRGQEVTYSCIYEKSEFEFPALYGIMNRKER